VRFYGDVTSVQVDISSSPDIDGDTIPDAIDNCPCTLNLEQTKTNNSGHGDACAAKYFINDLDKDCDVDGNDLSLSYFDPDTLYSLSNEYGSTGAP
jgi:hypothetical protein